jgi:hypothetical protein
MASPTKLEMESTFNLLQAAAFSLRGMVSVQTTLVIGDALIRSTAGPESTGWAQQA